MNAQKTFEMNATAMTANYFTFDHIRKTIVGTEYNFKMSGNPTKPQYEALMNAMAMQPNYSLSPIASTKKVEKKQSYEGLTIDLMEAYLNIYEGEMAEEARAKFAEMKEKKEQKKMAYPTIKSWFLELFPKFNVNKAKMEIKAKKLESAKAPYKVVKAKKVKTAPAVVELPTASNF